VTKKVIDAGDAAACLARKALPSLEIQTHAAAATPARRRRPLPAILLVSPKTNQSKPLVV